MNDIILRSGTVVDGTGRPGYAADIAVKDGIITAIGDLSNLTALRELSASGLTVSPGFIDSHSHSDTSFLVDSSYAAKLYQGITTEVCGQCGYSPFPGRKQETELRVPGATAAEGSWRCASFGEFTDRFERSDHTMAVNQAILVGHGALRAAVVGYEDRPVTQDELEQMKELLDESLTQGAWGLSLGLEYSPGFFADREELAELGKVVKKHDGLVTAHMRNEGLHIEDAIDELIYIGKVSGVHVHISHLKIDNFRVHGKAPAVWDKIQSARKEGVDLTADMYPYTASSTGLTVRCPKWSLEGGDEAVVEFLKGPRRGEILDSLRSHYFNAERAETCLFSDDNGCWPEIVGKTLRYVAEELLHTDDYAEAAAEVLTRTNAHADCIFFVMSEKDMLYFLSQDIGIGSDGSAWPIDHSKFDSQPHPRAFGTVPEFFRLAREHKLCPLEEAVRRVTSKPADMIGLKDRGRLAVGSAADITVFSPSEIGPRATYLDPVQLSAGVHHVIIGGQIALENGVQTQVRNGKYLKKTSEESI